MQRPARRSVARGSPRRRRPSGVRFPPGRSTLAVLGVAILVSCALVGTEERPASGGIYREAVIGQPLSLNTLVHPNDPIARDVGRLVYAGLVRVTDGTSIGGDLARDWSTTADGLTYTFRLRPEARWHDGQIVNSADVLATVALIQSPAYPGPRQIADIWRAVRAEAPDPTTVVFHLAQPFAPFIEACSLPILPQHLFGSDGSANLLDHPNSYMPIGAGPYRVRSVDAGGVSLVRNDAYTWARPLLDEIDFRYFADAGAAGRALADGDVAGLASTSRLDIAPVGSSASFMSHEAPLFGQQIILFMSEENSLLGEPAVRRATARAIDRRAIVDSALGGRGVPAYGPIPAYSWAYSPAVEQAADPGQARLLLDEAGWVGTQVRSRGGRELRVELASTTDEQYAAAGAVVAAELAAIGFRVSVQPFEPLDLYRERLGARRFDLAVAGASLGTRDPDPSWMWHSSQRSDGFNFVGYANTVADDLLARARAELDPARRLDALASFQRLWEDDVPSVVLASPLLVYTMSSAIHGVRLGVITEPSDRFQHLDEWYVRTQRVPVLGR